MKLVKCPYCEQKFRLPCTLKEHVLGKHPEQVRKIIEKTTMYFSVPPLITNDLVSKPKNLEHRKKRKHEHPKSREYYEEREREFKENFENKASASSPSAYGGVNPTASLGGYQDFMNKPPKSGYDDRRRISGGKPPKKRRVWTRRYGGSPQYPSRKYPQLHHYNTQPIKAIGGKAEQSTVEDFIIDWYDKKIDEYGITKDYVISIEDVVLKDSIMTWFNEFMKSEIEKYGVDTAIEIADALGYLSYFEDKVYENQVLKMFMSKR